MRWHKTLATLACGALFACVAWQFALSQEIWIDETTQLSGLTLSPLEVVKWLKGVDANRFGVPADRLGWCWSQAFGLTENSLRALSIACVGGCLMLTFEGIWRYRGSLAAIVAGSWLGLAPTFVTLGAEIRAYPFLLLCSALVMRFTAKLAIAADAPSKLSWVGVTITCVAACYFHYFGLVLTGAAGLSWLYIGRERKRSILPPIGLGVAVAASCVFLVPFISSAVSGSSPAPAGTVRLNPLIALLRLVYRILGGHPALGVYGALGAVTCMAAGVSLALLLVTWRRQSLLVRAAVVSVAAGLAVATLAGLLSTKFDAFSVSYNCWMLPLVALLIAHAVPNTEQLKRWKQAWPQLSALTVALVGVTAGCVVLLKNRSTFAHTGAERVAARVSKMPEDGLLVLHDGSGAWAHLYFPLRYTFGPSLRQGLVSTAGGGLHFESLTQPERPLTDRDLLGHELLLAASVPFGYEELGAHVRGKETPSIVNPGLLEELGKHGCTVTSRQMFVAVTSSELVWVTCQAPL
jgi:Dolichyl-phosphate-mannose-protein mannosyltransferase